MRRFEGARLRAAPQGRFLNCHPEQARAKYNEASALRGICIF